MSFRRFVYLVTDDFKRCNFLLRRVDMSRFFFPKREREGLLADPPPLEEGRLPPVTMKFDPPICNVGNGYMDFMLFVGGDSRGMNQNHRVLVTELTGRALLYDPESPSIRSLPSLTSPKCSPISLIVGNKFYILDTASRLSHPNNCFHSYMMYDGDWHCYSLAPPPYIHANRSIICEGEAEHVDSYTVVGGSSIWISKSTLGTHSFDTENHRWTKVGDWALPFFGHVQYVPEHKLWFGLSSGESEIDCSVCFSNLTEMPPRSVNIGRDCTPPQWINMSSYLVHLGHSRFCHATCWPTLALQASPKHCMQSEASP